MGYIYLVSNPNHMSYAKIGMTDIEDEKKATMSILKRSRTYAAVSMFDIKLYKVSSFARNVETHVHRLMDDHNIKECSGKEHFDFKEIGFEKFVEKFENVLCYVQIMHDIYGDGYLPNIFGIFQRSSFQVDKIKYNPPTENIQKIFDKYPFIRHSKYNFKKYMKHFDNDALDRLDYLCKFIQICMMAPYDILVNSIFSRMYSDDERKKIRHYLRICDESCLEYAKQALSVMDNLNYLEVKTLMGADEPKLYIYESKYDMIELKSNEIPDLTKLGIGDDSKYKQFIVCLKNVYFRGRSVGMFANSNLFEDSIKIYLL